MNVTLQAERELAFDRTDLRRSTFVRSVYCLFADLQWIARSPWVPASRLLMAARLTFLSAVHGLSLPMHSDSPIPGIKVQFYCFDEYFSLYREIFIRQEYSLPLESSHPLILDCGANIGLATIYFKRRFPSSRIIAFEPSPVSFSRLTSNIKHNNLRDVELRNEALGGRDGPVMLTRRKGSAEGHAASVAIPEGDGSDSAPVKCTRLSTVIEQLESVDLVKLDIEGAEYEVLADLDKCGQLGRIASFIIEYHERVASSPVECALSLLTQNGFHWRIGTEWKPWYSLKDPYAVMIYAVR